MTRRENPGQGSLFGGPFSTGGTGGAAPACGSDGSAGVEAGVGAARCRDGAPAAVALAVIFSAQPSGDPGGGGAAAGTADVGGLGTSGLGTGDLGTSGLGAGGSGGGGADGPGPGAAGPLPAGLAGQLSLDASEELDAHEAGAVLERLDALVGWAQAQQARVVKRLEDLLAREVEIRGTPAHRQPGETLTLTAAEVGALLRVPHMTALRVVSEAGKLVDRFPATLAGLSQGQITYSHARVLLDEAEFVPEEDVAGFEAAVLDAAANRTAAQLGRRVRTLRERRYPETIVARHRDALAKRRVWLEPAPDGMSCLTALMPAEKGQAVFGSLSRAARARKSAGDGRTVDQLRVDLLASALLGGGQAGSQARGEEESVPSCGGSAGPGHDGVRLLPGREPADARKESAGHRGQVCAGRAADRDPSASGARPGRTGAPNMEAAADEDLPGLRPEVMVIINAETLFGADDAPAELNGYGPISAEAARRLIRQVRHWTGLIQDPKTGEILAVGRRRRVPAGLARWLQARDGTCRFPGCSVNARRSELDHTRPYAADGPTDHQNLEHLCPKHHRLKTQGYWTARQPEAGTVEWRSPLGRRYSTDAQLSLARPVPHPSEKVGPAEGNRPGSDGPGRDHPPAGDIPPPF